MIFKDRNFDDRHDGGDIDGDGIVDPVDYWNGVFGDYWDYSPYDFDYDGIPDYVDLDSDNDSIPDAIEGADDEDFDFFPNNVKTNNLIIDNGNSLLSLLYTYIVFRS